MKLFYSITLLVLSFSLKAEILDTLFPKQWALKNDGQIILRNISELERVPVKGISGLDINWIDTSERPAPTKELIVAVLDSGLDVLHPDLKDRVTDLRYNFLDGNINVTDDMGHGTHVAGIIAANKNNIGIVGAADSRVKIMPLKVLSSEVNGFVYKGKLITDIIADAMVFAIKNGAKVINLSLGWPKLVDTQKVRNAFQLAESQNVLVIAATGNNFKDLPTFPCAYETVICVGALDNRGSLTDFSNHGSKVDIAAPGEYIVSTLPRALESRVLRIKNYEVKRGSSQAAPYVTAAMASLKLFNPEITNDRARNLLFSSSKAITSNSDRFIKFGMLDMKSLLAVTSTENDKSFLMPLLKNLTEIRFQKNDKKFNFKFPFKNISSQAFSGNVCLKIKSMQVSLDQDCIELNEVKSGEQVELPVSGTIGDLNSDSHLVLTIAVDGKNYSQTLVFTRDLTNDSELESFTIPSANFDEMAVISGDRRLSKMTRVLDKFKRLSFPEYFFLDKFKQTETSTVLSVLTQSNGEYKIQDVILSKMNRVLSVHRQDINLDGKIDYFIYTLNAKKDQIQFLYFDEKLKPLFGSKSTWNFPLSTFEGLPIDGGQEKFEWVQIKSPVLGKVLVPSFARAYDLPEIDNSKNILDRVFGKRLHLFYLNPTIQNDSVVVEPRAFDNVALMKQLRLKLNVFSDQDLSFLKTIPSTMLENQLGIVHALFAVRDMDGVKYYEVIFSEKDFSVKNIDTEFPIADALIYPILHSDNFLLTTLLNRSTADFLSLQNNRVDELLTVKKDWENPVIAMIGAFHLNQKDIFFVENRSTVTMVSKGNTPKDLPVYRDSSFPGQNFSETLSPIISEGRAGIYVNSTLIFGERLYAMVANDADFIRPMNLSVSIPEGCVPLAPESLDNNSSYNFAFLCRGPSKQVAVKFLPMSMN